MQDLAVIESFQTIAVATSHEIEKVKGSRFLARVEHVESEEEALAVRDRVRRGLHDARHHCSAWRVGHDGARFRQDDDGEPSGSAGKPILQQLDGRGLTETVVVVTRYFGGTKLGVGGLVRAYGQAAAEALELAGVRTVRITQRATVAFPYACTGAIERVLARFGVEPARSEYGESVRLELDLPVGQVEPFRIAVADATHGRASLD